MSGQPESIAERSAGSQPPPATPADLLFADLDEELDATRRTLERVPVEHVEWRPHEKSMPLSQLATHLAQLPGLPGLILTQDELDMSDSDFEPREIDDTDERLELFDEEAANLRELVDDLTWDRAMATWTMSLDGEVIMQGPRAVFVRSAGLSHMAHHRAQLGVYLRLLDVPVPKVYGPTADEPWGKETTHDRGERPGADWSSFE